jgi:hypothetical protein
MRSLHLTPFAGPRRPLFPASSALNQRFGRRPEPPSGRAGGIDLPVVDGVTPRNGKNCTPRGGRTGPSKAFVIAMIMYVASVTFCLIAQGVTYLGQAAYHQSTWYDRKSASSQKYARYGRNLMISSGVIYVISLAFFVIGSSAAIYAFANLVSITAG